jgi:tetratricopeptide (TPR) repeat protein
VLSGAFVFEAVSAADVATHVEAEEWGTRGLRLARDIGWRAGESYALMNLGGLYVVTARFGDALDALDAASEIARDIEHREWLTGSAAIRGHLYQEILASARAIESLEAAARLAHESGSRHFIHVSSGFLVDTLVGHSYLERAGEILQSFSPELPMQTIGQRLLWAARANWLLHSGNAEESVEIIDDLFRAGLNVRSMQDIPLLAWRRGAALERLGRVAEAEESLRAARAGLERLDQPGRIWKVGLDLARLLQMDGRPDEAADALSEASTLVERLSVAIPDELPQALLRTGAQHRPQRGHTLVRCRAVDGARARCRAARGPRLVQPPDRRRAIHRRAHRRDARRQHPRQARLQLPHADRNLGGRDNRPISCLISRPP